MNATLNWLESILKNVPLPLLEVWGRFSYLIGAVLSLFAFGGFTFRAGGRWALGVERHSWDIKAFLHMIITFVMIITTGFIGSFIVLVPKAQTFESLKDVSVFVCILLFGYPALLMVPIAYGISDLIEGIPLRFIEDWIFGYFMNPAIFWLAYQLIGKDPDFLKIATWRRYILFVVIFMCIEPQLWGYICSKMFKVEISYRYISSALFFTTSITWLIAPFVMMLLLPIAKRYGLFWAQIPDHVRERLVGKKEWLWNSGTSENAQGECSQTSGVPISMAIAMPFIALVLVMISSTAYFILRSAETNAKQLVSRLHHEVTDNVAVQLNTKPDEDISKMLGKLVDGKFWLAFVMNEHGQLIASSYQQKSQESYDSSIYVFAKALNEINGNQKIIKEITSAFEFSIDIVTVKPLSLEKWLIHTQPFVANGLFGQDPHHWILMTAMPEASYLKEIRSGSSQSAMAFALFLVLALIIATFIAGAVSAPICRLAKGTQAIALGNLDVRVPNSRLEEVSILSNSFNDMARNLSAVNTELRNAKEAAESANNIKSEFLDIAAHELRTPLTPISLGIEMAQRFLREGKPIEPSFLNVIAVQIQVMKNLVEDLFNASRLDHGMLPLRFVKVDLNSLVVDCIAEIRRRASNRPILYEASNQPVFVKADAVRMSQVIHNLFDNALKYSGQDTTIEVKILASPHEVRFSLTDYGHGIPNHLHKDLFTKFFRGDSDVNLKNPGLGLGLYVARKIIEMHNGRLNFESEMDRGSTFYFVLPRGDV